MPDHPLLPAGFNTDPINVDETNGAGTNWDIWPVLFDSYEGLVPLVITQDMLAAFDECADLVLPAADNVVVFAAEDTVMLIGGNWPDAVIAAESNIITFPAGVREQVVRDRSSEVSIGGSSNTVTLAAGAGQQVIRKAR